jgi:hypothetical protein
MHAHEVCCAQQTGMRILVVEALLTAIFLSEGRANTYRHRKYDRRIVLPIPSHSAVSVLLNCPYVAEPYECTSVRMATEMRLVRNKVYTREVHTYEMHACEVHAHEVHTCEMHVYEEHTHEMYAYEMPIYGRTTPVKDTLGRCMPEMHVYGRCTPMRDMPIRWLLEEARL